MRKQHNWSFTAAVLILLIAVAGCNLPAVYTPPIQPAAVNVVGPGIDQTPSLTPFQPIQPTPTPTHTPLPELAIRVDPNVPQELIQPDFQEYITDNSGGEFLQLYAGSGIEPDLEHVTQIYALAGPFPTLTDEVSFSSFQQAWKGEEPADFPSRPLLMSSKTYAALEPVLGAAAPGAITITNPAELLEQAYTEPYSWIVIPFDEFEPRWKIISLDGQNPLRREFDPAGYPLAITYTLSGKEDVYLPMLARVGKSRILVPSDRDPEQMTILLMTGVTALVRATGWMMDTRGIEFPASSIGDILRAADITHISNEVSFSPDCPPADPGSGSLRFCSDPDYFSLITSIGTDIVELSGNHVNDWGLEAMLYSLDLYHQAGIPFYSGGANQSEARQAVILEDHGNRFGFIGCNPAGPGFAWATENEPGSAACDLDWMEAEVARLKSDGILPVVTFQYEESYSPQPMPWQIRDFQRMAAAGAGLVSGSQAHSPQIFEFHSDSFIHYGPGNLFFDQMNVPGLTEATRWEFLDRYTIYQGKIIGVELVTAMLEDWSRPRVMTPTERQDLLTWIFTESGWNPDK